MSRIFGPIIQQGYVVPGLQNSMEEWLARGVGPFFVISAIRIPGLHYGKETETHITASFAMSGDQQIELIQPFDDTGPNIYSDYLSENPKGGLQHVAVWSDDVDAQLEKLTTDGIDYVVAQRHFGTHAYLDLVRHPGMIIQLMPTMQRYLDLFSNAKAAADDWDGKTDPIRILDWGG